MQSVTQTARLGRVFHRPGWLALPLLLALCQGGGSAWGSDRAEQNFANYSFAHELGSGVYERDGRLLQIYRLPFEWRYRKPAPDAPGVVLLLPVTLGFLDFAPLDILGEELPDRIDAFSFVPGIGLEFARGERLRIMPFAKVGVALANHTDVSGTLYSIGVGNEYRAGMRGWDARLRSDLLYSGVNYRGSLPSDTFLRWRQGAEARHGLGRRVARRELEGGLFGVLDWYVDPPTGPITGIDIPQLQFEAGVLLGTRPALRVGRVPVPPVGLSYRFAGDVSAWRLVFGAAF